MIGGIGCKLQQQNGHLSAIHKIAARLRAAGQKNTLVRTWQAVQDAKLQAAGNYGHLKGASMRPELSLHSVSGFKLQQAWLCR